MIDNHKNLLADHKVSSAKILENTHKTFQENEKEFVYFSKKIGEIFQLEKGTIQDQILKSIFLLERRKLDNTKQPIAKYQNLFLLVVTLPIQSLLFFCFDRTRKKYNKFDVVFEEFFLGTENTLIKSFYENIISKLPKLNYIFLLSPWGWKVLAKGKPPLLVNRRFSNFMAEPLMALRFLKFYFKNITFFLKTDSVQDYVYYGVIEKILTYEVLFRGISAKLLICAANYYWNPIKYAIAKKSIDKIFLIQKNSFLDVTENNYLIYCDIFFFESQAAIKSSKYIRASEKKIVGNVQLISSLFLERQEFDIFFIHDSVLSAWSLYDHNLCIKNYEKIFSHLLKFASSHPEIKIVYSGKLDPSHELEFKQRVDCFKTNNILPRMTYGINTHRIIAKSKVVVNFWSSLGYSAYALRKRVIWVNINGYLDYYGGPAKYHENDTIMTSEYAEFENKLLMALDDNNTEQIKILKRRRVEFSSIEEEPSELVAREIIKHLSITEIS